MSGGSLYTVECAPTSTDAHASVPSCWPLQRRVQDVISPIVFEAAYSLDVHVTGEEERELPDLTPVLRWKRGQRIAQKNQVRTSSSSVSASVVKYLIRKQLRGARVYLSPGL